MATSPSNQQNVFGDATCVNYKEFVETHRITLDYLSKFGSITEKAKAAIIFKLGSGGPL